MSTAGPSSAPVSRSEGGSSARPRLKSGSLEKRPNWFVRGFRSLFGYRKTSLTLLMAITIVLSVAISLYDNSLEASVTLPSDSRENDILQYSWTALQKIGATRHTYTSRNNDLVHDYLEKEIVNLIKDKEYIEYDNDLNNTNNIIFPVKYLNYDSVSYYESNNLLVRINGSDPSLPALLLSSHFDSVPSSFGVTDDGMGVASMLGLLAYFSAAKSLQPARSIVFNFNNNEEFGLYGAQAFLKHPWFSQVLYFLNLEGTGAGGKAVLFRGTDYGIVKHYNSVRFPAATSLFQQAFGNNLIHSETDYAVYRNKGNIRGLDLAFYKPRDIYHTAGDSIKNVNIESLWHMLSSGLDFTLHMVEGEVDLDSDVDTPSYDMTQAAFASFFNRFFAFPISHLVKLNVILLVVLPVMSLLLMIVVFRNKKGWSINFINLIKFPISFAISTTILSLFFDIFVVPVNPFLANNSIGMLTASAFALYLLLNYCILNGLNLIFRPFKGHQHDEKLVVMIQLSFVTWLVLLYSTYKLSRNRLGDEHSGEYPIVIIFCFQSLSIMLGLLGWCFKRSSKKATLDLSEDSQPLLARESGSYYGSNEVASYHGSSSSSICEENSAGETTHATRSFSYDWLVQFLLFAPLPSIIIYNTGYLILDGFHKSLQESLASQQMLYTFLKGFAVVWAIPFLPFVFKVNRILVLALLLVVLQGVLIINTKSAFDSANPLKLRFIETIDLDASPPKNEAFVFGRADTLTENLLKSLPSLRETDSHTFQSVEVGDGMLSYQWETSLTPSIYKGPSLIEDALSVRILKNSSSPSDAPYGMLTGELEINAAKNRNCKVTFLPASSDRKALSPVRVVTVFESRKSKVKSDKLKAHPKSYVFKDYEGINTLQLNKLDWDAPYHIAFQWVPEVFNTQEIARADSKTLEIEIECFWSELEQSHGRLTIPIYEELLHYSPNYVVWANKDRGLLSLKRKVEV